MGLNEPWNVTIRKNLNFELFHRYKIVITTDSITESIGWVMWTKTQHDMIINSNAKVKLTFSPKKLSLLAKKRLMPMHGLSWWMVKTFI